MSDLNHIPKDKLADIQEFYANSSSAGQSWYTWKKPRNVIFVNFIVLGGGGSGGAGGTGTAALGSAGGGGGGSSAQCNITFPAWALPDILYVSVGTGGAGGAVGIASYISIYPAITPVNYLLAYAPAGLAGNNSTSSTGGSGA